MKQCRFGFAGRVYVSVVFDIFVRVFYSPSRARGGLPTSVVLLRLFSHLERTGQSETLF